VPDSRGDLKYTISKPTVSSAVGGVKSPQVSREGANERPRFVGILEAEFWVLKKGIYALKAVSCISARLLEAKPNHVISANMEIQHNP
jgi:hypothetical protein